MQLNEGMAAQYTQRHDKIWPELGRILREAGIRDYVIYLDSRSNTLFASHKLTEPNSAASLPSHKIVKKWWAYMADIMETNPDDSPVIYKLEEMFYQE